MVSLFRSADKIYEDEAVVHLVLPPHHCHVTARIFLSLRHSTCAYLPVPPSPPWPIVGGGGPSRGHVFCQRGERGETGKTPPHAGWRRAQKILVLVTLMPNMQNAQGQNHPLLFCNFFYIVKIIEKSLFYEPEIGFIGKKTY